jgi:hypothetical protein
MSETLLLRVLFPNHPVTSVRIQNTDTPRTLALSGPPLKIPVILLHKGRCLCPYASLDSQGVASGDLIILYPVSRECPPQFLPAHDAAMSEGIFREVIRLADAAYAPLEVAKGGAMAYRQMWEHACDDGGEEAAAARTAVVAASEVSTQELPVWWEKRARRGRRRTKKAE